MLTLIEGGEVLAPKPLGQKSVLLVGERIGQIGEVDARGAEALGLSRCLTNARSSRRCATWRASRPTP